MGFKPALPDPSQTTERAAMDSVGLADEKYRRTAQTSDSQDGIGLVVGTPCSKPDGACRVSIL